MFINHHTLVFSVNVFIYGIHTMLQRTPGDWDTMHFLPCFYAIASLLLYYGSINDNDDASEIIRVRCVEQTKEEATKPGTAFTLY